MQQSHASVEMNSAQKKAIEKLRTELLSRRKTAESPPIESDGFVFTEVEGVTVLIGDRGGYRIPAVRTYRQSPLEAAAIAKELFDAQWERDRENLEEASERVTGHFSGRVNPQWYCDNKACPCHSQNDKYVRKGRSV